MDVRERCRLALEIRRPMGVLRFAGAPRKTKGAPSIRAIPVNALTLFAVQNVGHTPFGASAVDHVLTYGLRTMSGTAGGRPDHAVLTALASDPASVRGLPSTPASTSAQGDGAHE
jgi:hypothetical protein